MWYNQQKNMHHKMNDEAAWKINSCMDFFCFYSAYKCIYVKTIFYKYITNLKKKPWSTYVSFTPSKYSSIAEGSSSNGSWNKIYSINIKQEIIPVGWVPPSCKPYLFWWPPPGVCTYPHPPEETWD